jgi:hypothetical protein
MNDMAMNQLWATQQSKLAEKDAEIERLKELVESWKGGHSIAALDRDLAKDQIKRLEEALQRQDNKIIDLTALLTRAADALEISKPRDSLVYNDFIADLRKAAG